MWNPLVVRSRGIVADSILSVNILETKRVYLTTVMESMVFHTAFYNPEEKRTQPAKMTHQKTLCFYISCGFIQGHDLSNIQESGYPIQTNLEQNADHCFISYLELYPVIFQSK